MLKIRTSQNSDIFLSAAACSSVIRNEFIKVERETAVLFISYNIVAVSWNPEAKLSKENKECLQWINWKRNSFLKALIDIKPNKATF